MMTHIKVSLTASLEAQLDFVSKAEMIRAAVNAIKGKVDFVIFDAEATEKSIEDRGITIRIPNPWVQDLCYARVDDYGGDDGKVLTIYKASER